MCFISGQYVNGVNLILSSNHAQSKQSSVISLLPIYEAMFFQWLCTAKTLKEIELSKWKLVQNTKMCQLTTRLSHKKRKVTVLVILTRDRCLLPWSELPVIKITPHYIMIRPWSYDLVYNGWRLQLASWAARRSTCIKIHAAAACHAPITVDSYTVLHSSYV